LLQQPSGSAMHPPASKTKSDQLVAGEYGLCNYLVIVIKISQGYQELIEVSYYYGNRKL